jgi:hypothetical protein
MSERNKEKYQEKVTKTQKRIWTTDDVSGRWEVMRVVREEANPRTVKKAGPNGSTVANEFYLST